MKITDQQRLDAQRVWVVIYPNGTRTPALLEGEAIAVMNEYGGQRYIRASKTAKGRRK